jgi:hypothetical protein
MGTNALVIIAVVCLLCLLILIGLVGGYFVLAVKFTGDGSIIDDLVAAVSEPAPSRVSVAPNRSSASIPAHDPAVAPTIVPDAPASASASLGIRPSQGDLSLDDFFTDFSADAVNMSGDIPQMSNAATNRESGSASNERTAARRPNTLPVDASQVIDEALPEGAG